MTQPRCVQIGRTGSVYLIVLSAAMILTILGLASLLAVRVQRRQSQVTCDCVEARVCSQSAIELGFLYTNQDSNWRTTRPNGTWIASQALGQATLSLQGTDPQDGDLADSPYDQLVLTGRGARGVAVHKTEVTLVPDIKALDALNTCLHASGRVHVVSGKRILAFGGAVSTNGALDNEGLIDGDADAVTVSHTGTITGHLTTPADAKGMPASSVISDYISKATAIPFPGPISKCVLTPGRNPWGATNADGVYYINASGDNLTIANSRIQGTLIVDTGSKKLMIDQAVFMHSFRADYPVLIVRGNLEIASRRGEYSLSEDFTNTNFNPPGSPYLGQSDTDQADVYPNEVQGLVHVIGTLKLQQTACVRGAILCEGTVECQEKNTIFHVPDLYTSPPQGYTYVAGMKVSPGSFRQVVDSP